MGSKQLNCYCDHCSNNTCTTDHLCYAEWRLTNFDELVSAIRTTETPTNTTSSNLSTEATTATATLDPPIKLEKTFNCYNGRADPLLFKTICSETASNTSHTIRRCCYSGDNCNRLDNLLPTEQAAIEEFQRILPKGIAQFNDGAGGSISSSNLNLNDPNNLYEQYSDLPWIVRIIIIIVIVSLVFYTIALFHQLAEKTRKRSGSSSGSPPLPSVRSYYYDYSIKRVINNFLLSLGIKRDHQHARRSTTLAVEVSPNINESRLGRSPDDDGSEIHETVGGYDTNSMASREPLIRTLNKMTPGDGAHFSHGQSHMSEETTNGCRTQNPTLQVTIGSSMVKLGDETSSGSGKGQAYLSMRSVSHDIQLNSIIGRGFFGIVWRGEYKGQPVAVKIFSAVAEASWERETEIYQTSMLRHKNILGLVATDRRIDSLTSGFWLVTDYYPIGSLFDFLSKNTITMWDAIRMAFSIANGLSHLHIEIFGTRAKPAIAHRDMKSKNILVKNDGTCCIADLGMAVRYNSTTGVVDVPTNTRMGTRRYLAPEILDEKLNLLDFEAVKATDIYAFGLVLWEILRRTCLVSPEYGNKEAFIEREIKEPTTSGSPSPPHEPLAHGPRSEFIERRNLEQVQRPQQIHHGLPPLDEHQHEDESHQGESQVSLNQQHARPHQQPDQRSQLSKQDTLSENQQQHEQEQEQSHQQQQLQPQQAERQQEMLQESVETLDKFHEQAHAYDEFQVPYQEDVSPDPTALEMYHVVCVKKIRPRLSPRWLKFASMRDYVTLMTECWYEKPQARLSALRLRKSLGDLASKYFNLNIMEYD